MNGMPTEKREELLTEEDYYTFVDEGGDVVKAAADIDASVVLIDEIQVDCAVVEPNGGLSVAGTIVRGSSARGRRG